MAQDFSELLKRLFGGGGGIIPAPSEAAQPAGPIPAPAQAEESRGLLDGGLLSHLLPGGDAQHGSIGSRLFQSDPTKQDALASGLRNAGAAMMIAGGPSKDPSASSIWSGLGQGLAAGSKTYDEYGQDQADIAYKKALAGASQAKLAQGEAQRKMMADLFGDSSAPSTPSVMPTASTEGKEPAQATNDLSGTINAQRTKLEKLYSGLMQLGQGEDARPVFAQMNFLDNEMGKNGLVWDGAKYSAAPGYNDGLRQTEAAKSAGRVAGEESERLTDGQREYRFNQENPEYVTPAEQKALDDAKAREAKRFSEEQDVRKEYTSSPIYKRYDDVRASYDRIQTSAARNSGAGDLGVIYGYMKMLDPGSVVREGEFATAENASGVPTYVANLYNKILNGERLTDDQRKEFVGASKDLYSKEAGKMDELNTQYRDIATKQGLDASNIITQPKDYSPKPQVSQGMEVRGDDGVTYRFIGGNPNDKNNWKPVM